MILDRYTDYLEENYPEDIEALNARLGGPPSCSLGVEFRRKTRYNVCAIVQFLCLRLLARYPGLVDDLLGEVWSSEEIESGVAKSSGKFMEFYCREEAA